MKQFISSLLLLLFNLPLYSQMPDMSFGENAKLLIPFTNLHAEIHCVREDSKGNILVSGEASDTLISVAFVGRFSASGNPDFTFGKKGFWYDTVKLGNTQNSYRPTELHQIEVIKNDTVLAGIVYGNRIGESFHFIIKLDPQGNRVINFGEEGTGKVRVDYMSGQFRTDKAGNILTSTGKIFTSSGKLIHLFFRESYFLDTDKDGFGYYLGYGMGSSLMKINPENELVENFGTKGEVVIGGPYNIGQTLSKTSVFIASNKLYKDLHDTSYIFKVRQNNGTRYQNFGSNGQLSFVYPSGKNRITEILAGNENFLFTTAITDGTGSKGFILSVLDSSGKSGKVGDNGWLMFPMSETSVGANTVYLCKSNDLFLGGYSELNGLRRAAVLKIKNNIVLGNQVNRSELTQEDVYPNPTTGRINFNCREIFSSVQVLNSEGKILGEADPENIDLSLYPSGSYLLRLSFRNSERVFKIEKR